MIEQWDEMKARHHREKYEALQALNQSGYTQTEASKVLGMTLRQLNNWVRSLGIDWKVKQKGGRKLAESDRNKSIHGSDVEECKAASSTLGRRMQSQRPRDKCALEIAKCPQGVKRSSLRATPRGLQSMNEAEIAEKWVELARSERKRAKQRDGGPIPSQAKNQYNSPSKCEPPKDKSNAYNVERYEDICRLRKEGKSNREIGRILNVSDTSIRYWRRRYNIA